MKFYEGWRIMVIFRFWLFFLEGDRVLYNDKGNSLNFIVYIMYVYVLRIFFVKR